MECICLCQKSGLYFLFLTFFLPLYSKAEYFSENFDLQNSKIKLFIAIAILHLYICYIIQHSSLNKTLYIYTIQFLKKKKNRYNDKNS